MCKRSCEFVIEPWKIQYYTSVHVSTITDSEPKCFNIAMAAAICSCLQSKYCHRKQFLTLYASTLLKKVLRIAVQLPEDEIYRANLIDRKSFVVGKSKQMKVEDVDVIFME